MKVKIDTSLYDRARQAAEAAGYSSVDECVTHAIESEIKRLKVEEAERVATSHGLGYIGERSDDKTGNFLNSLATGAGRAGSDRHDASWLSATLVAVATGFSCC
jgi:hypothetical protein